MPAWVTAPFVEACARAVHVQGWWTAVWAQPDNLRLKEKVTTRSEWVTYDNHERWAQPAWALPGRKATWLGRQTNVRPGDFFTAAGMAGFGPAALLVGSAVGHFEWQFQEPYVLTLGARVEPGGWARPDKRSMPLEGATFLPRLDQLLWMLYDRPTAGIRLEIPIHGSVERRPNFGAWLVDLVPRADARLAELGCPTREVR